MASSRKMSRPAGYDGDRDPALCASPLFAAMPAEIVNNEFFLSQSINNMFPNNNNQPSSSAPPGAGIFGSSINLPPGASVGSVGAGAPKEPEKKPDVAAALANLNKSLEETRRKREANEAARQQTGGTTGNQGPSLTNNSSQQQQNQPASSGLFGSSTTQNTNTTGGGGLFGGNQQQSQPQQSGGLFGATNNQQQSQPQQQGGIFGSTNQQQNQGSNTGGSMFGGTSNQQQSQSNSAGGGGLFGNTPQPNQPNGAGGTLGGGIGAAQAPPSLFGGSSTQPKPSMFAGAGSGLGGSNNLFTQPAQAPPASGGATSMFGANANNPGQSHPSLLSATQHSRLNQSAPFGRLSMGQNATQSNPTTAAAKIDTDSLRLTTRFDDCVDPVKDQLEQIDKMIREQEQYCKQIEAFCPKHGENVESTAPDVEYIKTKADDAEQALISDAQGVEAQRRNTDKDLKDLERCHRVITNLTLPQPYQYSGSMGMGGLGSMYGSQQRPQQANSTPAGEDPGTYDMDLIGNYFVPMATELQKTVNDYAKTLTEIESHMRVMEGSAIAQAQQLAQQKNGMGGGQVNSDETVRELADTLRGIEHSILGVANVVGECREGVNELVLGRLGGN